MDNRGSASWIFAFIVVTLGLLLSVWIWITLDYGQNLMEDKGVEIGNDQTKMNTLNALWGFAPIAMLGGFILFVWITARTSRGGGYAGI